MKIGILTQPLHNNYGGLLQAFALQTILKRMGHDVWVINRDYAPFPLWRKIAGFIKSCIIRYLFLDKSRPLFPYRPGQDQLKFIGRNTAAFTDKNIQPKTKLLLSGKSLAKETKKQRFEAYVVGSDQVWRPAYSPCITNYYLDFARNRRGIRRISYAASFGVGDWEYSDRETRICSDLIKKFDAVSVREDSGVTLCKKYFDAEALHMPDPTLLLEKEDYIRLVEEAEEPAHKKNLMVYILDSAPEKTEMVARIKHRLNLEPFTVMAKRVLTEENQKHIDECVFPPVTAWLRGFIDADFIVTDSFHGSIFSILFNKPFLAIGNKKRGMERFNSLMKMFGLEERLIYSPEELTDEIIDAPVDWKRVNSIRSDKKECAINFLSNNLKR